MGELLFQSWMCWKIPMLNVRFFRCGRVMVCFLWLLILAPIEVVPYQGPNIQDDYIHRIFFRVFEQPEKALTRGEQCLLCRLVYFMKHEWFPMNGFYLKMTMQKGWLYKCFLRRWKANPILYDHSSSHVNAFVPWLTHQDFMESWVCERSSQVSSILGCSWCSLLWWSYSFFFKKVSVYFVQYIPTRYPLSKLESVFQLNQRKGLPKSNLFCGSGAHAFVERLESSEDVDETEWPGWPGAFCCWV